jgi:exonuclease VII small subunit
MTQEDLKRLEMNLTKSALKAKKYYVRGMVGHTESDQGFMPIEAIPVYNPIKKVETPLAELIEDIGILNDKHIKLQDSHNALRNEYELYKQAQGLIQRQNEQKYQELLQRVKDLEVFTLD